MLQILGSRVTNFERSRATLCNETNGRVSHLMNILVSTVGSACIFCSHNETGERSTITGVQLESFALCASLYAITVNHCFVVKSSNFYL